MTLTNAHGVRMDGSPCPWQTPADFWITQSPTPDSEE
jgi:hypothetical protein